jgi:hypothetical protein
MKIECEAMELVLSAPAHARMIGFEDACANVIPPIQKSVVAYWVKSGFVAGNYRKKMVSLSSLLAHIATR